MALGLVMALSACGSGGSGESAKDDDHRPWKAIVLGQWVRAIGNEPFWNAEVHNGMMTYRTPETPGGRHGPARGFAGRGGASFSGQIEGQDFTLAIERGPCRDGMSNRRYPFIALLRIGDDLRKGCAWTDRHPGRQEPAALRGEASGKAGEAIATGHATGNPDGAAVSGAVAR